MQELIMKKYSEQDLFRDQMNIIFSKPFRELQYKSQMFPLRNTSSEHNRLIHSLEVAQIGRCIAQKILKHETSQDMIVDDSQVFLEAIVAGCLCHDIGIPPFGHIGESSIRAWFREKGMDYVKSAVNKPSPLLLDYMRDFEYFDGNAQGFRVLTRYLPISSLGKGISSLTLMAYLKYVGSPQQIEVKNKLYKKPGYFFTEREIAKEIFMEFELENRRHPYSYIIEISDDLAYIFSDLEDGISHRYITMDHFFSYLMKNKNVEQRGIDYLLSEKVNDFTKFKLNFLNNVTDHVASNYVHRYQNIILRGDNSLLEYNFFYPLLKAIKEYVSFFLYRVSEKIESDLAGYKAIHVLLDMFGRLLKLDRISFYALLEGSMSYDNIYQQGLDNDFKTIALLTPEWVQVYKQSLDRVSEDSEEWFLRAHLIVDTITSLSNYRLLQIAQ